MDLPRSGGPGEGPSIDPELQRQLELQRELEQQRQQELIRPSLSVELDQHINQRPDLQEHLKQFRPEEQNALKQAIVDSAARFAPNASIEYVQVGKEDGKLYVQAGKYYLGVVDPEKALAEFPEQKPISEVPTQEISQQERLQSREQEEDKLQQSSGLSSSPYRGHSGPPPIRLPQEMTPERGPHLPERLHDIGQQVTQHIGDQLKAYSPEQQTQLTQALTKEISDFAGWEPQIKQISKDESGLLHVLYNKTGEITLDPQEVLQPERDIPRPQETLPLAEQQQQNTQLHIAQQVGQLTQHTPVDRMIMESRLREAVQDERIESLRLDGEDTFQLGLSNGMVLTATTHELLNMTDGRELLEHAQVDPAAINQQSGLEQSISQQTAYTVQPGDGLERIGRRLSEEHPDAAAWYVLQDLQERYGQKGAEGIHYSRNENRIIIHPGQHGEIDLSQKTDQELADAAQQFRQYMSQERREDDRRDAEASRTAEQQRQQAEREQAERDLAYQQYVREHSVVFLRPEQMSANNLGVLDSSLLQNSAVGQQNRITPATSSNGFKTGAGVIGDGVGGFGTGMQQAGGTYRLTTGANSGNTFSPKHYQSGWQGGSRARITTYDMTRTGGALGRASFVTSAGLGVVDIFQGYKQDGDTIGINAQQAVGRTTGSMAGAWGGAKAGALAGAGLCVWFGGAPAAPCAIIGGVIGSIGGGYGGSILGEEGVKFLQSD